MAWQNILDDPDFQAESYSVKKDIAENYFRKKIAIGEFLNATPEVQADVTTNFFKTIGEPPSTGILSALAKGFETGTIATSPAILGGAGEYLGIGGKALKEASLIKEQEAQPEGLSNISEPFYEAGKMMPASIGISGAISGAGKLVSLLPHPAAKLIGAGMTYGAPAISALIFGLSQAQSTLDSGEIQAKKLEEQGNNIEAQKVRDTSVWAARGTGIIEAIGEYFGNKYLMKLLKLSGGVDTPLTFINFLKTLAIETGTEVGQQYGEATVEKQTGIRPEANPFMEALGVIAPVSIMTALTGTAGKMMQKVKSFTQKDHEDILRNVTNDLQNKDLPPADNLRMEEVNNLVQSGNIQDATDTILDIYDNLDEEKQAGVRNTIEKTLVEKLNTQKKNEEERIAKEQKRVEEAQVEMPKGFRPVEKDEILPAGFTTKMNITTRDIWTDAPKPELDRRAGMGVLKENTQPKVKAQIKTTLADTSNPIVSEKILTEALKDSTLTEDDKTLLQELLDEVKQGEPYIDTDLTQKPFIHNAALKLGFEEMKVWGKGDEGSPQTIVKLEAQPQRKRAITSTSKIEATTAVKSPLESLVEKQQAELKASGKQRLEQLGEQKVNTIDTKTAVQRVLDGKDISEHIKEGVKSGLDIDAVANNLNELFTSNYAKLKTEGKLTPLDEIGILTAEKRLKSDIAKGYKEYLMDRTTGEASPPVVPKTSEAITKEIDDYTDILAKKYGLDEVLNAPYNQEAYKKMNVAPPKTKLTSNELSQLQKLYDIRDKIDNTDFDIWLDSIIKNTPIPAKETISALKAAGIDKENYNMRTYFLGDYLRTFASDVTTNLQKFYNHFAHSDKPYESTYAEFNIGGTADKPQLEGSVFNEDLIQAEWNKDALKKTQDIFNAISDSQGIKPINLSKIVAKGKIPLLAINKPLDETHLIKAFFKEKFPNGWKARVEDVLDDPLAKSNLLSLIKQQKIEDRLMKVEVEAEAEGVVKSEEIKVRRTVFSERPEIEDTETIDLDTASEEEARQYAASMKRVRGTLGEVVRILKNERGSIEKGTIEYKTIVKDLTAIASFHIKRGITSFSQWAKAMIKKFGEMIRQFLPEAWSRGLRNEENMTNAIAHDNFEQTVERVVDEAASNLFEKEIERNMGRQFNDTRQIGKSLENMIDLEDYEEIYEIAEWEKKKLAEQTHLRAMPLNSTPQLLSYLKTVTTAYDLLPILQKPTFYNVALKQPHVKEQLEKVKVKVDTNSSKLSSAVIKGKETSIQLNFNKSFSNLQIREETSHEIFHGLTLHKLYTNPAFATAVAKLRTYVYEKASEQDRNLWKKQWKEAGKKQEKITDIIAYGMQDEAEFATMSVMDYDFISYLKTIKLDDAWSKDEITPTTVWKKYLQYLNFYLFDNATTPSALDAAISTIGRIVDAPTPTISLEEIEGWQAPRKIEETLNLMSKVTGDISYLGKKAKAMLSVPIWNKVLNPLVNLLHWIDREANRVYFTTGRMIKFLKEKDIDNDLRQALIDSDAVGVRVGYDKLSPQNKVKFDSIRAALDYVLRDRLKSYYIEDAIYRKTQEIRHLGRELNEEEKTAINREANKFLESYYTEEYFPRFRFGNQALVVKDKEGKTLFFGTFESRREMMKTATMFMEELGEMATYDSFDMREKFKDSSGVLFAIGNMRVLENMLERSDDVESADIKKLAGIVGSEYLKLWAGGKLAHRKEGVIAGYGTNIVQALHRYLQGFPKTMIKKFNTAKIEDMIDNLPEEYQQYGRNLVDFYMGKTNKEGSFNRFLRTAIYDLYLALKPAFALVNLTQRVITTLPRAIMKSGSIGSGAKIALQAQKQEAALYTYMAKNKLHTFEAADVFFKNDPETKDVIKRMVMEGEIQAMRTHEVVEESKIGKALAFFGVVSEKSNRLMTAFTAIQLGKEKGLKGQKLYDFVLDFEYKTNWLYSKANRPTLARGVLAPVMMFKSFILNDLHFLNSIKKDKKALSFAIATRFALSGTAGIYGSQFLLSLIGVAMKSFMGDDDWELRVAEMRKKLPTWLVDGLPSLMGISGSASFGNSELFGSSITPYMKYWSSIGKEFYESGTVKPESWRKVLPSQAKHLWHVNLKERFNVEDIKRLPKEIRARAMFLWEHTPKEQQTLEKIIDFLGFATETPTQFYNAITAIKETARRIETKKSMINKGIASGENIEEWIDKATKERYAISPSAITRYKRQKQASIL